jgi:hypothetical protein
VGQNSGDRCYSDLSLSRTRDGLNGKRSAQIRARQRRPGDFIVRRLGERSSFALVGLRGG